MRIAVVGVGLIGGSIALAARQRLSAEVTAFDLDRSALVTACERGAADAMGDSIAATVADADAAFVAVPVGVLAETVADVLSCAPDGCVVTDVGSTKRVVSGAHEDQRFVGGHPLAGAETAGIEHARADLFDGATWYLTPTAQTSGVLYERLHRLIGALGARPAAIDADTHDTILALVSHLPHVLANVLVSQTATALSAGGERLPAVGPSFRDMTRVAGANTSIWTDIYLANRDALAVQIEEAIARLTEVRRMLDASDAGGLARWNDAAAGDRRRLLESQLAGDDLHELRVSVPNRPGVVAQLALELGRAGVNIVDLALYPAPDMSEGVVALWIAGDAPAARSTEIIEDLGFTVFRP
jgi:prephenate dehydrogenase